MSAEKPHILVTRPIGQQEDFIAACLQRDLQASHLPCLEIQSVNNTGLNRDPAELADTVLFTSKNAVVHADRQRPLPWPGVNVHAIGMATVRTLQEKGQSVSIQPHSLSNSEAYIQQMSHAPSGRLLIIKGQGGRGLIAEQLISLGWEVSNLDVYRRVLPATPKHLLEALFSHKPPDIISIGSDETLANLMLIAAPFKNRIRKIPLIVNSHRCRLLAADLGFDKDAMVAEPPGDTGQLMQLDIWLAQRTSMNSSRMPT